jgi:hypothetical protein
MRRLWVILLLLMGGCATRTDDGSTANLADDVALASKVLDAPSDDNSSGFLIPGTDTMIATPFASRTFTFGEVLQACATGPQCRSKP